MNEKTNIYQDILSYTECLNLLEERHVNQKIINHCKKVCQVALEMSYKLQNRDIQINVKLVEAASLLHDICKGEKKHEVCGADLMENLGYKQIGDIILVHMELPSNMQELLNESTMVYLADKMVIDDKRVSIEQRFFEIMDYSSNKPLVRRKVLRRYRQAKKLKKVFDDCCNSYSHC